MDPALAAVFRDETEPLLDQVEAGLIHVEQGAAALADRWRGVLGMLHTIKGNCGMVEQVTAQERAHVLEQALRASRAAPLDEQVAAIDDHLRALDEVRAAAFPHDPAGAGPAAGPGAAATDRVVAAAHVTVAAERLDALLEISNDLTAVHARLGRVARRAGADRELAALADGLGRAVAELRHAVTGMRQVPVRALVARFERPVRDLARQLGKRVELRARVGDLAVDKHVVDHLGEPLLHILRNAVDHGLEEPRARVRAGKPEAGTITVTADAAAGVLTLVVRDDGAGIDAGRLLAAARARGLAPAAAGDRAAILDLVFAADVTTAGQVSQVSGRGVGLDQVRRALAAIGGTVAVDSQPGAWTELRVRAPLAIAVQPALVVHAGDGVYAVPFRSTIEAVRVPAAAVDRAAGQVRWRGLDVPEVAVDPGALVATREPSVVCVIVEQAATPAALVVDGVLGYQELVIRQLDPLFAQPRGLMGAAALIDGRVALVVDTNALTRVAA